MRADLALVKLNLAKSRTHAQDLIKENVVYYNGEAIKKSSQEISDFSKLEVRKEVIFVSRGAYKLQAALTDFSVQLNGKVVADVGASTGGFTEVSLLNGASKVYAIDVGHNQLAKKLCDDLRVINMEGINIKSGCTLPELVDVVVADLSFISLKLVLNPIMTLLKDNGEAIVLIKPQFEVGKAGIGKNGIVKDKSFSTKAILELFIFCEAEKIAVRNFSLCAIEGKDGNQEFFFHLSKNGESLLCESQIIEKLKEWDR